MIEPKRPASLTRRRAWAQAGSLLAGLLMLVAFIIFIALTLSTPIERRQSLQEPRPAFDPALSSKQQAAVSRLSPQVRLPAQ